MHFENNTKMHYNEIISLCEHFRLCVCLSFRMIRPQNYQGRMEKLWHLSYALLQG